jgi:hypothetical protein
MLSEIEREIRNEANMDAYREYEYRTRRPLTDDGTLDLAAVYENLQHLQDDEAVDYLVELDITADEYHELQRLAGVEQ